MNNPFRKKNKPKHKNFSELSEKEQSDYKFGYEQLDVIDTKSTTVVRISTLVLLVSAIFVALLDDTISKPLVGYAVIFSLLSVLFALYTTFIHWGDDFDLKNLKKVRNQRTYALTISTIFLIASLSMYFLIALIGNASFFNIDTAQNIISEIPLIQGILD